MNGDCPGSFCRVLKHDKEYEKSYLRVTMSRLGLSHSELVLSVLGDVAHPGQRLVAVFFDDL